MRITVINFSRILVFILLGIFMYLDKIDVYWGTIALIYIVDANITRE